MQLEEIVTFFDYARDQKIMPPNAVHNWSGAVSSISHCLPPGERTIEFVRDNLELLKTRLLREKPELDPRTVDAYLQRAAAAVSHFLAWKTDPTKWEKEMGERPPRRGKRRKGLPTPESGARRPVPVNGPVAANVRATPAAENTRHSVVNVPVAGGEMIRLDIPESFTMNDVWRVVWTLSVHASDFDPEVVLRKVGRA